MMPIIFLILLATTIIFLLRRNVKANAWKQPTKPFPIDWRDILTNNVRYYQLLSAQEQRRFEYKVQEFLLNCKITGIGTPVHTTDKLLVAASAVIPIFAFKDWRYVHIKEVLLYASTFNKDFETEGPNRPIAGIVGSGYMEGKMILSKPALELGFRNETDKHNTAIHEFVHLIDKADGLTDGIPAILLARQYTIPWIDMMSKKIEEIFENKSDINPYGGTNRAEFFSVVSEYFFERPDMLAEKHPELYALLSQIFKQDLANKK